MEKVRLKALQVNCFRSKADSFNTLCRDVDNLLRRQFTTTPLYKRRGGPRSKLRHRQDHFDNELADGEGLENESDEMQFVWEFKDRRENPQNYSGADQEWVKLRRYGRIRMDEENRRTVYNAGVNNRWANDQNAAENAESVSDHPVSFYEPGAEQRSSRAFRAAARGRASDHDQGMTAAVGDRVFPKHQPPYEGSKTANPGDRRDRGSERYYNNEDLRRSRKSVSSRYTSFGRPFKSSAPAIENSKDNGQHLSHEGQYSSHHREGSNVISDPHQFFAGVTSTPHGSHPRQFEETNLGHADRRHKVDTNSGLNNDKGSVFEEQYFEEAYERERGSSQSKAHRDTRINLFEEQYFGESRNTISSHGKQFENQFKSPSAPLESDTGGRYLRDYDGDRINLFEEQYFGDESRAEPQSPTREAQRSLGDSATEHLDSSTKVAVTGIVDDQKAVSSKPRARGKTRMLRRQLAAKSGRIQPEPTGSRDSTVEQQYFENREEGLQLPWDTVEDSPGPHWTDPDGKSKVVHIAERNEFLLNRGLRSIKSQSGVYEEKEQTYLQSPVGTRRAATADDTQQRPLSDRSGGGNVQRFGFRQRSDQFVAKSGFGNRDMTQESGRGFVPRSDLPFGQHPRVAVHSSELPKTNEHKERGPVTLAQMRQRIKEEKKTTSNPETANRSPLIKDRSWLQDWQIKKKWTGKVDSKGFRILSDQVTRIDWQTTDEMITILKRSILYEDDDLLAISKPYGLPSHGGPKVHHSVARLLPQLAGELSSCEELYVIHRLDKETTGVMLLAKNKATSEIVSGMFRRKEVVKQYLALTKGCPKPTQGIIDIPMVERSIKTTGQQRMVLQPANSPEYVEMLKDAGRKPRDKRPETKPAVTNYRVLDAASETALVLCQPESGLKHQIRCHLGYGLNTPILGDHKYSHFDKLAPQKLHPETLQRLGIRQTKVRHVPMHLHAKQLILPEYRNGRNFFVSARLPKFFLQNMRWLRLKL